MTIESVLAILRGRSDCEVMPPTGQPQLMPGMRLPPDVERLYDLCGGLKLAILEEEFWMWEIVPPHAFKPGPAIVFEGYYDEGIWGNHWAQCFYVIAQNQNAEERIVVSCGERYFGMFFDAHQESFSCDDMRLVARTLPELLLGLADASMGRLPRPAHPSQQVFLRQL